MEILKIDDKIIEYELIKKKIKNIYISVKNGIVTVKVSNKMSKKSIEEVLKKRANWIITNVEKQKKNIKTPKKYVNGEIFKVLGKDIFLEVNYEDVKRAKLKFWLGKFIVVLPKDLENNLELSSVQIKKLIDKFYDKIAEKEIDRAMRKITMEVRNCTK